jgi:type IV pilus assembly protein PilB
MKQLGKLLIEEGMVDQAQLDEALAAQKREGGKLGSTLVKLGFLTEEALYYFLSVQLDLEFVEAADLAPELVRLISAQVANKYGVVPYRRDDVSFTFLSPDPSDPKFITLHDDLMLDKRIDVKFCVATESGVRALLEKYYPSGQPQAAQGGDAAPQQEKAIDSMQDIVESEKVLNPDALSEGEGEVESGPQDDEYDENKSDDAPVIRLVQQQQSVT